MTSNFRLYVYRSSDEATVDVNEDICAVTISTGLHIHDLQRTGIICAPIGHERVINQTGIKTRYVRLNLVCNKKNYILGLCEMKVYGKLGKPCLTFYSKLFRKSHCIEKNMHTRFLFIPPVRK